MTLKSIDTTNPCKPVINLQHDEACPFLSFTNFSRFFLEDYP
jgi:hypothetical protein